MSYSKSFLANQWSRRFIKKGTKDNKYKQDTFYEWNSHAHCKLYQKKKKTTTWGHFSNINETIHDALIWILWFALFYFKSSRYSQEKNIKNIPTKKEETQMTYNLTILSNYYWITLYHCKVPLCLQRSISYINNFANVRILFFGILLS